jgi:polysaccharide deacetylase family protein (PEP-CTERM system associated)
LYNFQKAAVKEIVTSAKKYLEDVSGKPVWGFRAPDFSITKDNLWAFDLLREAGYEYDSSVYPTSLHDVYGIGDFPRGPFSFPNGLIEIPMSTAVIWGRNIPFGGGGYLRLYPLSLTRKLFHGLNNENIPGVIYLHPFEVGVAVTRFKEIAFRKKLRTYAGIGSIKRKLARLLQEFSFMAVEDYLKTGQIKEISDGISGQENIRIKRT